MTPVQLNVIIEDWTKPWSLPWFESQMPDVFLLTITCGYWLDRDPGRRCERERAMIAVGPNMPSNPWLVIAAAPMAETILDQDDAELSKGAPLDPWYMLNRTFPNGVEHQMWLGPTTGSVDLRGPWKIQLRGCLEHNMTPQSDLTTERLYRTMRRLQGSADMIGPPKIPLSALLRAYDSVGRGA